MLRSNEQRKVRRLRLEADVEIAFLEDGDEDIDNCERTYGKVLNASTHGFTLQTAALISEGSTIKIWIQVENVGVVESLALTGTVVRSITSVLRTIRHYGIELSKEPTADLNRWQDTMFDEIRHVDVV